MDGRSGNRLALACSSLLLLAAACNDAPTRVTLSTANRASGVASNAAPAPADAQTIAFGSGMTRSEGRDLGTEVSLDGGATWQPAFVLDPHHSAWTAPMAGTWWISSAPSIFGIGFNLPAGTPFRARFVLPADATAPSLRLLWHVDNDLVVRLNDCLLSDNETYEDVPSRFNDDVPDVIETANASCFRRGENVLSLILLDGGGGAGIDYSAAVTYQTAPSENDAPVANAGPDQALECASHQGASVALDGSSSRDDDGTVDKYEWFEGGALIATGVKATVALGLGVHTLRLVVTDDDGASDDDLVAITVQDTKAPNVTLSASPVELWPPNHKHHAIDVSASATDICDASLVVSGSVVSSEPDGDGTGDGDHTGDVRVVRADGTVLVSSNSAAAVPFNPLAGDRLELRAERNADRPGRTYTITLTAMDRSGNSATKTFAITVPHDKGG